MEHVFFIGGSTCSGKSTLARSLVRQRGWRHFCVDDHLGEYAARGAESGGAICAKHAGMSLPEFWMRDPEEQCEELVGFYHEVFPFALSDLVLEATASDMPIVAEGIAFLPELLSESGVDFEHCAYLVTAQSLHDELYRARAWTSQLLEGCEDRSRAFQLWMERDDLFAQHVRRQAFNSGYRVYEVESVDDFARLKVFAQD
jgi:2-phosphoglycerate kinase